MTKRSNLITVLVFLLFIGAFFILNLAMPDETFSPVENKELQTMPAFSFDALFNGNYTRSVERYCSDQFPFRENWISLKARLELLQGKMENNGVFPCGDKLLEPVSPDVAGELDSRIGAIRTFVDNIDVPVTLALIPTSAELYADQLPEGVENLVQEDAAAYADSELEIPVIDLKTALYPHREEYVFYRTDHHWTSLGAFYAYGALAEPLGYIPRPLEKMTPKTVSEEFFGTAYSSSGFFWIRRGDSIETFVDAPDEVGVLRYESAVGESGALYEPEMLSTKDKYRFFLGGNCPRVVIDTGNDGLPSLLLVRDSYADSLVPFLLAHYSRIHLIDLRYFRQSVSAYIAEQQIDSVLLLYSVPDFCTYSNINLLSLP